MTMHSLEHEIGPTQTKTFLIRILRRITQYREGCKFSMTCVSIDGAMPLARLAVKQRLRNAENLLHGYLAASLRPFETVVLMKGDTARLVFPPVVEVSDNRKRVFIIDGIHRLLVARDFGLKTIYCMRVEGESLPPLPCKPVTWGMLRIQDDRGSIEDNFPGMDLTLFRFLSVLFKSPDFIFSNRSEMLSFVRSVIAYDKQPK